MALELGKTIQEMTTGEPGMSAHELTTIWPAFFRARRKWQEAEEAKKA